mgnify:CR=1 FL=1
MPKPKKGAPAVAGTAAKFSEVAKGGNILAGEEKVCSWKDAASLVGKMPLEVKGEGPAGDGLGFSGWLVAEGKAFEIERVESRYASGPKPWTWLTEGAAVTPG